MTRSTFSSRPPAIGLIALFTCVGLASLAASQELRVGVQSHVRALDVQAETSNAGAQFLHNIYDTLLEIDTTAQQLKFKPGLAVSWQRVAGDTLEIKLRPNVKFHDGSVMTADDVAFSLNRVFKIALPAFRSSNGRFFYNFDRAEAVDASTVRVVAKKPDPLMEILLAARNAGVTSKAHVERVGFDQSGLAPIGTGPYRVASFKPNQEVILERFDDFWGEKAPLQRIRYVRIPEMAPRITALVNGDVDFIVQIPPDQEHLLRNRPNIKLVGTAWPMFHVYVLNMSVPPLDNPKIRRALNLAIDRDALVKALWDGKAVVPKSHQFPGTASEIPGVNLIRFDPAEAQKLLREAGYSGAPITLNFQQHYYTYGNLAAQAVADMWKDVGINVKLQVIEGFGQDPKTLMTRDWSNPLYYPDLLGAFDTHWTKSSWVSRDKFFLPELAPEWEKLYSVIRFSLDPNERRAAHKRLLEVGETELVPWVLLYQPYESFAMNDRVTWSIPHNVRPYVLSFRAGEISVRK